MSQAPPNTPGVGTLIVVAKEPVPGRVKTRLVPPLTYAQAADLAAAAIADTLTEIDSMAATCHLLAWDGRIWDWLPSGWSTIAQPDGELDARLVAAFGAALPNEPAILVGMDTPQLRAGQLTFDADRYDACLGLAHDGGYWAIGLRDPSRADEVISGVPMSRADTGRRQLARLIAAGLRVQLLEELTDVDTYREAQLVARLAPHLEFATAVRAARLAG